MFKASSSISTHKGSATGLLKIGSKRRRTRAEIDELREEQDARDSQMARQNQEIRLLEDRLELKERQMKEGKQAQEVLTQMLSAGALQINEKGEYQLLSQ